jgi:NitT/TauT family transport system ATP-binding protein
LPRCCSSCGFAELFEGDIRLPDAGRRFAEAGMDERKALFAKHVIAYVPLAAHIRRVLDERPSHRAPMLRFKDELEDHIGEEEAEHTPRAVTSLARYAELFAYDAQSATFNLESPA